MKKAERVRRFLERLAAAEPCASHDDAHSLIVTTLNAIEDEHSGVLFNPAAWENDGRLYPPQLDNAVLLTDLPGVLRYRSVGHWTFIAPNGAFRIEEIAARKILLDRPGADGRPVGAFAAAN